MTNNQLDLITIALDKLHDEMRTCPEEHVYTLDDVEHVRAIIQDSIVIAKPALDTKGLKDREAFNEEITSIMLNQGVSTMALSWVTKEGHEDYDAFVTEAELEGDPTLLKPTAALQAWLRQETSC